jgi:hypothetical protein
MGTKPTKEFKKKIFLANYSSSKSPFLGPKNVSNFIWLQLVPGTTFFSQKKYLKNTGSTWY